MSTVATEFPKSWDRGGSSPLTHLPEFADQFTAKPHLVDTERNIGPSGEAPAAHGWKRDLNVRKTARSGGRPRFTSSAEKEPVASENAGNGLTVRELEVLSLAATGATDQHIADTLFIARRTVTSHMAHILSKMNAANRTAAAMLAVRSGLI